MHKLPCSVSYSCWVIFIAGRCFQFEFLIFYFFFKKLFSGNKIKYNFISSVKSERNKINKILYKVKKNSRLNRIHNPNLIQIIYQEKIYYKSNRWNGIQKFSFDSQIRLKRKTKEGILMKESNYNIQSSWVSFVRKEETLNRKSSPVRTSRSLWSVLTSPLYHCRHFEIRISLINWNFDTAWLQIKTRNKTKTNKVRSKKEILLYSCLPLMEIYIQ